MSLVNILQKINQPLFRDDFIKIIYRLIQSDTRGGQAHCIDKYPYNQLQPILDEQYTLTILRSRNMQKEEFDAREIAAILGHLYRYSHVARIHSVIAVQTQPRVVMEADKNGRFLLLYRNHDIHDKYNRAVHTIKDFSYIREPIPFTEMFVKVNRPTDQYLITEMENLMSAEKCDQFMAFWSMIGGVGPSQLDNSGSGGSGGGGGASTNSRTESAPEAFGRSRKRASRQSTETRPSIVNEDRTSTTYRVKNLSLSSRGVMSLAYWCGYYRYGFNSRTGVYAFKSNTKAIAQTGSTLADTSRISMNVDNDIPPSISSSSVPATGSVSLSSTPGLFSNMPNMQLRTN